jgi:molecular chaperone DnaJ
VSQTAPRDPYEVLGVARDADASTIKKAFRKLARELHPDVNQHDPQAEERFKEAAEAYEILSDDERRALYDRHGHEGLRSGGRAPNFEGFGSINDLFDAFFGGGAGGGMFGGGPRTGPSQGDDVALRVRIDLEAAFRGEQVDVQFEAVDRCGTCNGNGAQPGTPIETCERCGGQGRLQAVSRSPFGQVSRVVACDVCGGDGKVPREPCGTCDGRGMVVGTRELQVDVPAGIESGQRIRLSGRGHAGERGGPPGDLYVLVEVEPHERFLRDGDDLVTAVEVGAPHAALGTTVTVETFDGPRELVVEPGTQPGSVVVLRGEGMPNLRRPGRRGDLRAVVDVVVPRRLTKDQRELLEQLAASIDEGQTRSDESVVGKLRRLLGAR